MIGVGPGVPGTIMSQPIDVTLTDLHAIQHRLDDHALQEPDYPVLSALLSNRVDREESKIEREAAKVAAAAAKNQGQEPEGEEAAADAPGALSGTGTSASTQATAPGHEQAQGSQPNPAPAPGHGRNGQNAFTKAKRKRMLLAPGIVGSLCEKCGKRRLKRYRERTLIRVIGQPMFTAEVYEAEQARCPGCRHRISAAFPSGVEQGIGKHVIYHWSACALLIVIHYTHGLPFKRLEGLHQSWGIPFPDANQWEIAKEAVDLLRPLIEALKQHAASRVTRFRIDDTGTMVLEIQAQIEAELAAAKALGLSEQSVRTGINATCVRLETPEGTVILYYTGRHHAGEIIDRIFDSRPADAQPVVKVSDGASKNFDHAQRAKLIEATCHAHAFLKFRAIKEQFPAEYQIVGESYGHIFENDQLAEEKGMTPEQRMDFHQQYSQPWLEKIHVLCAAKIASRLIEPRSPLWEPTTYFLNQWPRLTKFLEVPGVPLDTNLVEQNLIIPVRYLATSFNFQTKNGSEVGDAVMSLVQTAHAAGVEPVAYLEHCLAHHEDLKQNPEKYLPWAYRDATQASATARAGPAGRAA
jgi:transposase